MSPSWGSNSGFYGLFSSKLWVLGRGVPWPFFGATLATFLGAVSIPLRGVFRCEGVIKGKRELTGNNKRKGVEEEEKDETLFSILLGWSLHIRSNILAVVVGTQ